MSTPFSGSRLANLRQKRVSQQQKPQQKQVQPVLTLLQEDDNSYQPSSAFGPGRTATRFLKGRIQKPTSVSGGSNNSITGNQFGAKENKQASQNRISLKLNQNNQDLKLVLNDSPMIDKKKLQSQNSIQAPQQKRVLIQKRESQQIPQPKLQTKPQVKPQKVKVEQQQPINPKKQVPQSSIKQQQIQQSKQGLQNQNQLIQCPQGCGRKFNRKALQKHSKACKLVFMSKRKEFNSQAKRLTSQEQATLVKKNKLQEKKAAMNKTKAKDFGKTGDNWKNASKDFRSAIKAIKKDGDQKQQGEQMKIANCQYCQKPFAQVLLQKHIQNCLKRKQKQQKEKKKTVAKKK